MASDGDFKSHQETFNGVTNMIKWGTVATVIIVVVVVFLIAG